MLFTLSNPLYNTVIVFVSIMALIYIYKPEAIYDRDRREFRQFGTDNGKTLMPIYIIAILMAIILYVLFNQLAKITSTEQDLDNSESSKLLSNKIYTEKESDLSSLKNQMAMMNHNIAQLNQLNQMNQIGQIHQINNQLANLRMSHVPVTGSAASPGSAGSGRSRRSEYIRGYDTSGIYRNRSISSNGSNGSDGSDRSIMSNRSIKSIDADNIVNSVLASARPSSYTGSVGTQSVGSTNPYGSASNRAILPNNFSI